MYAEAVTIADTDTDADAAADAQLAYTSGGCT